MSDTWHVYPVRDLLPHDTETDGCWCGPTTEPVMRSDGSNGWLVTHHSLDGRELQDADLSPAEVDCARGIELWP